MKWLKAQVAFREIDLQPDRNDMTPGVSIEDGIKMAYQIVTFGYPSAERLYKSEHLSDKEFAHYVELNDAAIAFLAKHEEASAVYVASRTPTIFHLRVVTKRPGRGGPMTRRVTNSHGETATLCGAEVASYDMLRRDFAVSVKTGFRPKPEIAPCPVCVKLFQEGK